MLVGRRAECERIDLLLAEARAGKSGTLVVLGEPGIGKSALLAYARTEAAGWLVLSARGVESEAELPFAALDQLLRPLRGRIGRIPEPQARALEGALALGAPTPADRFAAAAGTVSLLAAAAEDAGPLLCLVDDAHWLDPGSAEVLVFACRRFRADKVAILIAAREGGRHRFAAVGLPELLVAELETTAAKAVLERTGIDLAPPVATKLLEFARGNPLALLELPAALTEAQRVGREPLVEPLPVGASVEQAFVERARGLPAGTQRALVVAAACDDNDLGTLLAALAVLGLSADILDPAESAGLMALGEGHFVFRHPLVRSALYQAASRVERRRAHRALVKALASDEHRTRRAWHLAAATTGPNEEAAAALEEAGREAHARSANATAASMLERAAHLSLEAASRARRLVGAGESFWMAGQSEKAQSVLVDALELTADPALRADIQLLRGRNSMWTGPLLDTHRLRVTEAERIEATEPTRAAMLMSEAVLPCFMACEHNLALATARRAAALADRVGGFPAVMASMMLGGALLLRGETVPAAKLLNKVAAALGLSDALGAAPMLSQLAACLVWMEEYDRARQILITVIDAARSHSAVVMLPFALATSADHSFRTGRLAAAYADASESVTLAIATGQDAEAPFSFVMLARTEAVLGREDDCRAHASQALELARRIGAEAINIYVASALGLLDLGLGRPEAACSALEAGSTVAVRGGLGLPAAIQWAPDLIESYAQLGRRAKAHAALATFTEQAEGTGCTWALASAARCRALLASEGEFEHEFQEALRWHDRTPTPFERARTVFAYGERLRRAGRRVRAREKLRSAAAEFERMGALPWLERALAELRASGETVRQHVQGPVERLTAQELQVALIVANGATNREAAARLFLSPKTIEFHLSHIFRKLGLRSRTELARRFASRNKDAIVALLVSAVNAQSWVWDATAELVGLVV